MINLEKWQLISFFSRGIAMGLGLFQTFFIIRILSVGEYGIVQLAVAVGGALGIYQHLGLGSGSTREISAAKDETEIFKIFTTSIVIRYMVTIPIALGLFFGANAIAVGQYSEPALILPLKIYAITLMIQSVQSMLNAVIAGTQRFKQLFIYQAAIAVVSVALYVPLVYLYRIEGYFYAMLAFNVIASIVLSILAFKPLRGKLVLPSRDDFKRLMKELLSISLAIYAVKVVYTMWEKAGPILLGYSVTVEAVGIFSLALLFAKKLNNISDAVTDINLPVFSERFVNNIDEFKSAFTENFNKIFSVIVFFGFAATFWSTEIITIVVGDARYDQALPLILPLVFTFIFYSLINILKSSIFIPAKFVKEIIIGISIFLFGTLSFYFATVYIWSVDYLIAMTYAMFFGALIGFIYLILSSQAKLSFRYVTHNHVLLLVQAFFIALSKDVDTSFIYKALLFVVFSGLYVWGLYVSKFITKADFQKAKRLLLLVKNFRR